MRTPEKECSDVDPDPPETICLPLLDLQVLRILPLPPPTKWPDKHPTLTGPNTSRSSPALHPVSQPLVKTVYPCDPTKGLAQAQLLFFQSAKPQMV